MSHPLISIKQGGSQILKSLEPIGFIAFLVSLEEGEHLRPFSNTGVPNLGYMYP